MLIFGFGPGKAEDLGEIAPATCPFCRNNAYFHYVRSKKSFSLFFVPIIPYGTDEYLLCPVCTRGLSTSAQQRPAIEAMRTTTTEYRRGHVSEPVYQAETARFWAAVGMSPDGDQVVQPAPPPPPGAASSDAPSWVEQIASLQRLHDEGVLTDEEFDAAKGRLLGDT